MNVVSLSLDPHLFDQESVAALRARAYGTITTSYTVVVPTPAYVHTRLSENVEIYGTGSTFKLMSLFLIYKRLRALIREGRCDVVSTQDAYFLGLLGYFAARRHHLGFEIQILGLEKLSTFRKMLAVFVLKKASVIRALSARLGERLVREFRVPKEKINVVPIYVDVGKLGLDMRTLDEASMQAYRKLEEAFKKEYGACTNFLTVSRLVSIKNIEMQLRAVQELVTDFPQVRLHIVGDGPERAYLESQTRTLGIENQVIFHKAQYGYALGMYYINCDCCLLTSFYEGWGMVITEAATAGLPIIMTDVGCAGELIVDGESGLIIPVSDTEALIKAMRRIVEEPELRSQLSLGATKALAKLPSFEAILEKYRSNWHQALQHRL